MRSRCVPPPHDPFKMEMITHEAPGMELPAGLFAGGTESFEEATPVDVVAEGEFAVVPAAHEVVDLAGVLDLQGAGHGNALIPPDPHYQLSAPFTRPLVSRQAKNRKE